ncbi:MAG: trypsin-like peptidase domain-containing protein [candidate division WOR-3 bacterium]
MLMLLGQITLPNWDALLTKDKKDAVIRIISFGLPKLRSVGDVVADWNVSTGSGFFVDKNGTIITNSHVIRSGKIIAVLLNGPTATNFKELVDRLYFAEVIYDDPDNDIAVLKITGENFPTISLSSRETLNQGEPVAALGYPGTSYHDNELKVMFGFVASDKNANPIALNMSVNPGNSGGPLIDRNGDVIGVVFAKEGGGREAISYAVPTHVVKKVLRKVDLRGFKGKYAGTDMYEAYEELGRGLIKALFFEDYNEAITHAQKAIEIDPNYAEGHFFYGFLAYKYKAYKIAQREYNTAYKLKPSLFDDNYNKETVEKLLNPEEKDTTAKEETYEESTESEEDKGKGETLSVEAPKPVNIGSVYKKKRTVEFGVYFVRGYADNFLYGDNTLTPDDRMEAFLGVDLMFWNTTLYVVKNSSFGMGLGAPFVRFIAFLGGYERLRFEGLYTYKSLKLAMGIGILNEGGKNPASLRTSLNYKYKDTPWILMISAERIKLSEISKAINGKTKEERKINTLFGLGLGLNLEI